MMVVLSTVEHRDVFLGIAQQAQGKAFPGRYMGQTTIANYEGRAKVYQEIGEIVNHSSRTLFLAPEFGFSLMYHGRLSGEAWPGPGPKQPRGGPAPSRAEQRSTEKRFNALYSEHSPDYFIVVSRFTQRNRKADFWKSEEYEGLKRLLTENFPVVVVSDDFIVFDLRKARLTGEGQVRLR
jgi:hypothetical protein